jgi:hypothetical protein
MIGIDPHKVAYCRGDRRQGRLEGAGGVGGLLAQRLVGVGETVVEVPAASSARVRLDSGRNDKTDSGTPVRRRSSRYGTRTCGSLCSRITGGCSDCWPGGTTS